MGELLAAPPTLAGLPPPRRSADDIVKRPPKLSWNPAGLAAYGYRPTPTVKIKGHKLGFKVSWAPQ